MKQHLENYIDIIKKLPIKKKYTKDELLIPKLLVEKKGDIEIYGGRFETADGTFVLNKKDFSDSVISVTGGTFINYDPSNSETVEYWDGRLEYLKMTRKSMWNEDYFQFFLQKF
mgnify:CR=1 FL=1